MRIIDESMFPEFIYLPKILMAIIGIGVLAALWGKRLGIWIFLGSIAALGIGVLYDMYLWGYDYGHNLDPMAAIKVPDMTYQPPLIGYKELLNFLAYSGPDTGGWLMLVSGGILGFVLFIEWKFNKKTMR
jgi:copper chaperone NosL